MSRCKRNSMLVLVIFISFFLIPILFTQLLLHVLPLLLYNWAVIPVLHNENDGLWNSNFSTADLHFLLIFFSFSYQKNIDKYKQQLKGAEADAKVLKGRLEEEARRYWFNPYNTMPENPLCIQHTSRCIAKNKRVIAKESSVKFFFVCLLFVLVLQVFW